MSQHPALRRGSPRTFTVLQALVLAFLGMGLTAAGPLAEWYVDVNAPNCAAGSGSASAPFCNIMDAVNAASGGDTIHIAPGTYVENLVLDKDLTLIGTSGELVTIVDGAQHGSVVTVGPGTTTSLTGLTLTNGQADRGGGLFIPSSATPTAVALTSSTITGNTVSGGAACGGGIYSSNGSVTLTNATVSGNTATSTTPGRSGRGGGIYSYLGDVSLTSSTVAQNTASGYDGGAGGGILSWIGTLTLSGSTVSDNTATIAAGYYDYSYGGGFYAYGGTMSLVDTTVSGNDAAGAGGGIFIDLATLTLTSSTVTENTAAGGDGGGIFNSFGSVVLRSSTVSGNAAYGAGGGIASGPRGISGDGSYSLGTAILTSSTVSGNSALWGGGLYNHLGAVIVKRSELSANSALFGGAMNNYFGTAIVSGSTVDGNSASGAGGGFSNSHGELVLTNSTVTGNAALGGAGGTSGGGGIYSYTYFSYFRSSIALRNTTVAGNTTADPGAVGGIQCNGGAAALSNSILWGNAPGQLTAGATVTRSIVQGGWTGAGAYNLDADPLFVDPASGLFQLSAGSPAIDAGRNGALSGTKTDLDGNPRFVDDPATPDTGVPWRAAHVPSGTRGFGPIIDLGAYEFQPAGRR